MRLRTAQSSNQIDSGDDVSPLIAAPHLQRALVSIEKNQVVVGLQQRIAEFRERNSFVRFEAPVDSLLAQQIVDGEVLSDIA